MTTPEEAAARLRSRGWRMRHSLWVLPTALIGMLTWASFLYVGVRARRVVWIVSGAVYLAALIVAMSIIPGTTSQPVMYTPMENAAFGALVAIWFGGFAHALAANRAWLRLRAGLADQPWYARESTAQDPPQETQRLWATSPPRPVHADTVPDNALLDVNTASEHEIANLPGVGPILAMRVVSERTRRGGYRDVDELASDLYLPPHILLRIRERVTFSSHAG